MDDNQHQEPHCDDVRVSPGSEIDSNASLAHIVESPSTDDVFAPTKHELQREQEQQPKPKTTKAGEPVRRSSRIREKYDGYAEFLSDPSAAKPRGRPRKNGTTQVKKAKVKIPGEYHGSTKSFIQAETDSELRKTESKRGFALHKWRRKNCKPKNEGRRSYNCRIWISRNDPAYKPH